MVRRSVSAVAVLGRTVIRCISAAAAVIRIAAVTTVTAVRAITAIIAAARDGAADDCTGSRGTQPQAAITSAAAVARAACVAPTSMAPAAAPATPTSRHSVAARHRLHGRYVGWQGSRLGGIDDAIR